MEAMHKGTIGVYDARPDYWARTRRSGGEHADGGVAAATRLREMAGDGLVVDLGCGPGRLLPALGRPAVGVDASRGMLDLAAADGLGPLVRGDIEALPFLTASTQGAFGNFSYQHLPREGFVVALDELRRVLRPRGLLDLAVHAGDFEGDVRPGDDMPGRWFTYWAVGDLTTALDAAGFDVLSCEENLSIRVLAQRRPS